MCKPARAFLEAKTAYEEPVTHTYRWWPLAVTIWLGQLAWFTFFIILQLGRQDVTLETHHYFDVHATMAPHSSAHGGQLYTSEQLVFADTPNVLFVATHFTDSSECFLCGPDGEYDPASREWRVTNSSEEFIAYSNIVEMVIIVVSRIQCMSQHHTRYDEVIGAGLEYIFSNFNSIEPHKAPNHRLPVMDLLKHVWVPFKGENLDSCSKLASLSPHSPYANESALACCAGERNETSAGCPFVGHLQ